MNPELDATPTRDLSLDLFRGFALIFILIDHIKPNVVAGFTPQNAGFSDMGEVFVFVSGVSCGIAYGRRHRRAGFLNCQAKALVRVLQIYLAYVITMIVLLPIYGDKYAEFRQVESPEGIKTVEAATPTLIDILSLEYCHFGDMTILTLYMVLLLFLPALIAVCARNKASAVIASIILYISTQIPFSQQFLLLNSSVWFLEPCAYQLLFCLGVTTGAFQSRFVWPPSRNRILVGLALLILQFSFIVRFMWPEWEAPFSNKSTLGPLRVLHFLALVTAVGALSPSWYERLMQRVPVLKTVCILGRKALFGYCVGEILVGLSGHFLAFGEYTITCQVAATFIGVILNCLAAECYWRLQEKWKQKDPRKKRDPPNEPSND